MRMKVCGLLVVGGLFLTLAAGSNKANAAATANYVGINLTGVSEFSPEQPFLNIFKSSSQSNTINGWLTSSSSALQTNEEGYLQVDSDGYVTSLKANPTPPGGQVFTFVQTNIIGNQNTPPGASQPYPGGSYTLQFQGAGTFNLTGGDVSNLSSSTPGISISGTQITSTMSAGNTATVTFTVTPSQGMGLEITALPNPSNYIKAISIVQSAYQSAYAAGELFSPRFKAELTGYSRLRFMDWMRTNNVDYVVKFTGQLASGATSGTISSLTVTGNSPYSTWPLYSGTYNFLFGNGQVIPVTATYGSANLTWSMPLSSALPVENYGQAFVSPVSSWSNRPLLSNAIWSYKGVPMEAMVQLCNELGVDGWFNIPGTAQAIGNYANSLAQLLNNGTGANLTGSNLSSFTGLNGSQKAYIEYMNEYWNGSFSQFLLTVMMGTHLYGPNYPEWFGSQVAGIGDTFYSVYGASAFSSRVVISMSQQSTNPYWLGLAMNTPDWTSRAYTHHIGEIHTGAYFGLDWMSAADVTQLQSLSPANQVNAYFCLAYSNDCQGHIFSSVPAAGYIPNAASVAANDISAVSSQPWASLPHVVYEGGSSNSEYSGNSSAWGAMNTTAHRDPRTQYLYYDPTHQLSSSSTGYFPAMVAAGITSVNILSDVEFTNSGGDYGALESVMQTVSPLSSAPPKYQGIMNFAGGGTGTKLTNPTPMAPTNLVVK
jgi:hypothetical protein